MRNREPQPYYCGADTTRQGSLGGHKGQAPTRAGIDPDPDFDFDFDFDNDLTDRQPLLGGDG